LNMVPPPTYPWFSSLYKRFQIPPQRQLMWRWHLQYLQKLSKVLKKFYRLFQIFLIGIIGDGVQLGPLGTAAINRPILAAPGDYDDGEIGGMMVCQGKPK
jgi:hypothetical protein